MSICLQPYRMYALANNCKITLMRFTTNYHHKANIVDDAACTNNGT